jgi:hypothetical protein
LKTLLLILLFAAARPSYAQGRVVINEYMPWTLNGCGPTSEFIELMNFGPGPMDISCYILTDGDYTITIPPGTIIRPGEFFLISGTDILLEPCGNIDSNVTADLNWNTCNCTNLRIPSTGDGLFTDGGFANEQVVLLDPNLRIVDAVVRDLPVEPSKYLTTRDMSGCPAKSFDLDSMNVRYEVLGMSTGRGNSFARKLDGDCGWVKDPQQSGNATNNTPGETSDANYQFTLVKGMDCDSNHGSIDVYVDVVSYDVVFPMSYIIAFDRDNNNIFDFNDVYTYGIDSTPPSIAITGLPLGHYKINVASVDGCFLQTFEFGILECSSVLTSGLVYFRLQDRTKTSNRFEWMIAGVEAFSRLQVEKSSDGKNFVQASDLSVLGMSGTRVFTQSLPADAGSAYYRLRMISTDGRSAYSAIVYYFPGLKGETAWPNPVKDILHLRLEATTERKIAYSVFNASGMEVLKGTADLQTGSNLFTLHTESLSRGLYTVRIDDGKAAGQPISLRFVKH